MSVLGETNKTARTRQPPPLGGWGVQCPDPGEFGPLLDFDQQISITVFADKLFCFKALDCPGVSLFDGRGLFAAIGFKVDEFLPQLL